MRKNTDSHQSRSRFSVRLEGYDYRLPGAYFVTLVCQNRERRFGGVLNGQMTLNSTGKIILSEMSQLNNHFHNLLLSAFIIMPNHLHGIFVIVENVGATHPAIGKTITKYSFGDDQIHITGAGSSRSGFPGTILSNASRATRLVDKSDTGIKESINDTVVGDSNGSPLRMRAPKGPLAGSLGAIIGQLKSRSTKRIWKLPGLRNHLIWQRNYYEHIIRNEHELQNIALYIENNPLQWEADEYFG